MDGAAISLSVCVGDMEPRSLSSVYLDLCVFSVPNVYGNKQETELRGSGTQSHMDETGHNHTRGKENIMDKQLDTIE